MEDIKKIWESYTNQDKCVIAIDELLNDFSNLNDKEKFDLLKNILICSENQNAIYEKEIKNYEKYYQNRETIIPEKRKVIYKKKINLEEKTCINETIKNHQFVIKKLININFLELVELNELIDIESIQFYILGLLKEIVDYQKIADEAYLSKDKYLLEEIQEYIFNINKKITYLNTLKNKKIEKSEINKKRIVFLETTSHRSYFLEDIDGLDEFYKSFSKLFLSLENGRPIKTKYFNNNNRLNGLTETRDPFGKTRIFYDKLNEDTFIILKAIIKKEDNSLSYQNQLESRYTYYLQNKDMINDLLENEKYTRIQEEYLISAKEKLGIQENNLKKVKRGKIG